MTNIKVQLKAYATVQTYWLIDIDMIINSDVLSTSMLITMAVITDSLSKRRNEVFSQKTKLNTEIMIPVIVRAFNFVTLEIRFRILCYLCHSRQYRHATITFLWHLCALTGMTSILCITYTFHSLYIQFL